MMKKLILFILAITISGCGPVGKVIVKRDDFKNTAIVSLQLEATAKEKMADSIFASKYQGEFRFVREIGQNKTIPTKILITVKGHSGSEDITTKAFLKINGNMKEMTLGERSSEIKSETSSSSDNVYGGKNSGGYTDYTKPTGTKTTVTTTTWKELKGTMALNADLEEKLNGATSIILRVYSGPDPVTFAIEPDDINKIKKYLAARPEDAK